MQVGRQIGIGGRKALKADTQCRQVSRQVSRQALHSGRQEEGIASKQAGMQLGIAGRQYLKVGREASRH